MAALCTSVDTGKKEYDGFVKNVIDMRSHSIHDPSKRISLALFNNPRYKTISKQRTKIKTLHCYAAFVGQLYVTMQNRSGDFAIFQERILTC